MSTLKGHRLQRALTIIRRGQLSKSHLSDPKEGLPMEAKIAQEEPVEVVLKPVAVLDMDEVRSSPSSKGQDNEPED